MPKLTKNVVKKRDRLASKLNSTFSICFRYKLEKGYRFTDLSLQNIRELQSFLNMTSQMSFEQVEKKYKRDSDKNDVFNDEQVTHYGFGKSFRIHGIIEQGEFVVLRLDPNHNFHNK